MCVQAVGQLMSRVQARIQAVANDDTESLSALLNIQDVLIFCYGMDEDEIGSEALLTYSFLLIKVHFKGTGSPDGLSYG